MDEQKTPFFDILNTIAKIRQSFLKRIEERKRNRRARQKATEDLIRTLEQLRENEASMEAKRQVEGKKTKRSIPKTKKIAKKKKPQADIMPTTKTQEVPRRLKSLRVKSESTSEMPTKSTRSVQENKPSIDAQLPKLKPNKDNGTPINTSDNFVNDNHKMNEKPRPPLQKTVQNKPLMKSEGLFILAKKVVEDKSSIDKNKTSNDKLAKNRQKYSTTNTKHLIKKYPASLLKKGVQKKSNLESLNTTNKHPKTTKPLKPANSTIENKSSAEKKSALNQKYEKNRQNHGMTNTKPLKKEYPKSPLKNTVRKKSNSKLFNNKDQDIDEYINSIIDDL